MSEKNTTLEQSLLAYRVIHTPTQLSWKQHYVNEMFSSDSLLKCSKEEQEKFSPRLKECAITIFNKIQANEGGKVCTLQDLVDIVHTPSNMFIPKTNRKVVYSTSTGERPIGKKAFELWNGFQVIDMDIKDEAMAKNIKSHLFERLKKYNWFLGVVMSSSGKGLHVYTKIQVPQEDQIDTNKRKLLFLTNFRHKYSFVYLACTAFMEEVGFSKDDLLKWMDLAMFKPQQGAFIGYDGEPLISTHFFEDFIYVNFDNVSDMGHPDIDWVTYPDLKEVFKRWEWFENDEDEKEVNVEITSAPELTVDTHNKVHYKHFERWRLANTLVKIYGQEQGYKYLRMICSNAIKDKELQADCITAARHMKPVDTWAVNRLNTQHGFQIKLNVGQEETNIQELYSSIDNISNPTLIKESPHTKTYYIKKNEYLGNIKWQLLKDCGQITLIEAGAGVGKTEMVKSLVRDGKRVMMVMPFTSTIKSKVEKESGWEYSYGNRKVRLDATQGLALTIDKFSRLNMMDVKEAGFDYIFIDESHLLFQSEYRPVMPKVIDMIRNTEIPIIMMSGTPVGETVFFDDIVHLKVIKEDVRRKEFHINIVDQPNDVTYFMCRQMACDIANGKRVLFPTNKGTLYKEKVKAAVQYFLEHDHTIFEPVVLNYYKKSNMGEDFMDDVNFKKSVNKTQILMCSNFLSVGVDILDKYNFSIYFNDLWMPQEVEQFANRLRSNDLYIYMYIAAHDSEGNSRDITRYKNIDLKLNNDEIKNCHSIIRLCNAMIERNPVEFRYNSLIASIINNNKFVEYNDVENKYYLNETAYKVIFFERKYREYVQQLPVLAKGMVAYGYTYDSSMLGHFSLSTPAENAELVNAVENAYNDQVKLNTKCVEELMEQITEDRLTIYRDVLEGKYEIKKGKNWGEDLLNHIMTVKNIEIFEKVVPIFVSMSKLYTVKDIREVFEFCREKNDAFNFAHIRRIRQLLNIIYNNKRNRLDLPIKEFMEKVYAFADRGKCKKLEIDQFINDFSEEYARKESKDDIRIWLSPQTMEIIKNTFSDIFKCLVDISHPKKGGVVTMTRVELFWKEREQYQTEEEVNENLFVIQDFLDNIQIKTEKVDDSVVEL